MKTEIFLFRHGRTAAGEKKLYCGKTDLPLSKKGEDELLMKKNGKDYPDISHCKIYTSGLLRASQTQKLLYPNPGDLVIVEKGFQEIDFGDFEMKSYEELKENPEYQKWLKGEVDRISIKSTESYENPCPNGESWQKMNERVLVTLKNALKNENSLAIFSHGGPISAIMAHFFPTVMKSLYEWQPDFGEGYKIIIEDDSISYIKIPCEEASL